MRLRIFVDITCTQAALTLLREGTAEHELVFPEQAAASVLHETLPGPGALGVDVAFGQPALALIESEPSLRWVHVSSAGFTRYDTPEFRARAAARSLLLSNSSSVYDEPCAEHLLMFLLAGARQLPRALVSRASNESQEWQELRRGAALLRGARIALVGFGAIGRRLVQLLAPFEAEITAFRRAPRGDEPVPTLPTSQLGAFLEAGVDHLVNILPASVETQHFFDARLLQRLKPGALFYNVGRGSTVDQAALLEALRAGRLRAAWLDVTEPEPLPVGHELGSEPRCFITPHIAGGHTHEALRLVRHFLANLARFERGEPLLDRVI